jgi:Heterokaryon incompatibility protein (HET)
MYEHLSVEEREVRLLCIDRPSSSSSSIHGILQTVSLRNCGSFVALSYAWGDGSDTVPLKINGHTCQVSSNLFSALQHLSRMAARLVIWVDAICINQGDQQERADQVRLMGDIYKNAEHVLVWLGPADEDSDLGLSMINDLGNAYHKSKSAKVAIESIQRKYYSKQDRVWTSMSRLLRKPWWGRLWTVQEVAGRQVSLICGTTSISWNAMYHTVRVFEDLDAVSSSKFQSVIHHDVINAVEGTHVAAKMRIWKTENLFKSREQLLFVVSHCRSFGASDPRDRIYACIGLAQPLPGFEVEYLSPFHQTYTNFAITHINYTKGLGVVREAGLGTSIRDPAILLPSWVPDWRHPRLSSPLYRSMYQASRESKACASFSPGKLSAKGILVDRVAAIAAYKPSDQHDWLKLALHNQPTTYRPLGIPQLQAYFRTILTDLNVYTGDRLDPKDKSFYEPALNVIATIAAFHSDSLPDYMSKFAAKVGMPLRQSLLGQMLQQDDPEVARAYWEWEAEEPQAAQGILIKLDPKLMAFERHVTSVLSGRCFTMTSGGYMGLVPDGTKEGDIVCILMGCDVPLVLREVEDTKEFVLIGECFVLGMTQGEIFEDGELEKNSESITIV